MNLINDRWIPVRRSDDTQELIAPWQLTETDNPLIALDAPRPDFNGALMQFLIGLLQTAATPESHEKWLDWLEQPPEPEVLKEKFSKYTNAFELHSDQGSFMQDFEIIEGKEWPIEKLIMESPGDNTMKLNKDHFFKRNQYKKMCPSCAATSLFSFQLNTQGFGASHRVSLRGKGALTTLVVLDTDAASDLSERLLWVNAWLNVLDEVWLRRIPEGRHKDSQADIFPWTGKTRVSTAKKVKGETVYIEDGQATTHMDTDRFQVFWPMPCRVRLVAHMDNSNCDLCNTSSNSYLSGFMIQKFGVDYVGDWRHPLSPHRFDEQGIGKAMRVPSDGLKYQHWLGLVQKTDKQNPALVAERYQQLAEKYREQFRLYSFGYEIDRENKARCWYESTFPLFTIPENIQLDFTKRIQSMTDAAYEFAVIVRTCVKDAWFKRPGDAKGDTSFLTQSFYQHTESDFFQAAKALQKKLTDGTDKEVLHSWHATLRRAAMELFDYWASRGDISQASPRRTAQARNKLKKLAYSKKIREALQLPNQHKSGKSGKEAA